MRWLVIAMCAAFGCNRQSEAAPAASTPSLVGWWRSADVCFELFANGDFELSVMGGEPKQQVLGHATVTARGVTLDVKRIWRARLIGPCRKVHELGTWADSLSVLGTTFAPKSSVELTVKRSGDDQIELCGKTCATLTRATPNLAGRWRRAKMEDPNKPEVGWKTGEVLEINIDTTADYMSHVWLGAAGTKRDELGGVIKVTYDKPDRFTLVFTPGTGEPQRLSAQRLTDERIEVCRGKQCTTLERQFDAYHTDLY